ncbi:hypothetical protein PO124_20000 [Bacillus licheniformis]|nr:hypothetical protein [Bacillus licheniformis]
MLKANGCSAPRDAGDQAKGGKRYPSAARSGAIYCFRI